MITNIFIISIKEGIKIIDNLIKDINTLRLIKVLKGLLNY